jgi:hypothetical protein
MSLNHAALFGVLLRAAAWSAEPCPNPPVRSISSSKPPSDVCIPDPFLGLTIDFFDDYSWRLFTAMVWPAARDRRGAPDAAQTVAGGGPRVFETFKSLWEVFHDDGSAPLTFDGYEPAAQNACRVDTRFGSVVLASKTGYGDIGQAGIGELLGPLAAQNGRYLRYQTLYNRVAYDFIVRNKYYLRSSLPAVPSPRPAEPVIRFPDGSIVVKVAWLDVRGLAKSLRKRFYTRTAILKDPETGVCSRVAVALVGLHIIQKTPSRPQWIWSSFEQVDAVPMAQGIVGDFILNNGTPDDMPALNPLPLIPLPRQPVKPFNVLRLTPVSARTSVTNLWYKDMLKGTPWKYYQLVTTQWPLNTGNQATPVSAAQNGDVFHTFPGIGEGASAETGWANTTMETFDQARPELGCMSCHNQARLPADFVWSVLDHAYPPQIAPAPSAVAH